MSPSSSRPAEVTEIHTRLLRQSLARDESRSYWEHHDPSTPAADRATLAFEQRWFGSKSMARVRLTLANMAVRYDAYPAALEVLRGWPRMGSVTSRLICHWHLQLADPLYRSFSGDQLVSQRERGADLTRDHVASWIRDFGSGRWATSTTTRFANALTNAASEAGLVKPGAFPRALLLPTVTDEALLYLLQLLRGVNFEGSLIDNPYLRSVGLQADELERRLHSLPGLSYHRLGNITDFEWAAPDLVSWARERNAS